MFGVFKDCDRIFKTKKEDTMYEKRKLFVKHKTFATMNVDLMQKQADT